MWRAAGFNGGEWRQVQVFAIEGEPFSTDTVRARAIQENLPTRLLAFLEQEASPRAKRDAIELWAQSATEESAEFEWASPFKIERVEEGIALYTNKTLPTTAEAQRPTTLAWHDRTAVIVPLSGNDGTYERVILEYFPGLRDEQRVERLRYRYGTPEHTLETVFDWRGYYGRESAVIDHWNSMRRHGRGFVVAIGGTAHFAIGSVLKRLRRPQPTFHHDPTMQRRLIAMAESYPLVEAACPDLAKLAPIQRPRVMVFVHGTVSCGLQGLKDLFPGPQPNPGCPVVRYEHDTFRPIDENGRELADLIRNHVDAQHLLIAGHSRGGLVARVAVAQLRKSSYPGRVEVFTFGTPHFGTPVVDIGGRVLNLLFKLGEDFAGAIPILAPLTKAYGYLADAPTLPPGIEDMREDSRVLSMLDAVTDSPALRSWGSAFDIDAGPSGFGVAVEGLLAGALSDRTHDLVVPTASALAAGSAQPVLNCSHIHYFADPAVNTAIGAFCAPPAGAVAPVAATAAGPQIVEGPDYAVIGGVRLAKHKNPAG